MRGKRRFVEQPRIPQFHGAAHAGRESLDLAPAPYALLQNGLDVAS